LFAISRLLTPSKRIHLLALATILLAHHFNVFRADILRDHGYWAFYLFSVYWLLRYFKSRSRKEEQYSALLWSSSLLVASLFRLEGIIFLVILPCMAFGMPGQKMKNRIRTFLQLNSLLFFVLVLVLVLWMLHPVQSFGRLDYLFFQITKGCQMLMRHWHQASTVMGQQVLSVYSARDASLVLMLALGGYYLVSLVDVLTLGYFVLAAYAMVLRLPDKSPGNSQVLWPYVAINFLITVFFLAQNFFLSRRYLMAMALTLMLWVPFAIENLIRQWRVRRWPVILAVVVIVTCSLGGFIQFGTSKKYLREAGEWLALHTSPNARLYSNDSVLLYYSTHAGNSLFDSRPSLQAIETNNAWRQYDWLAIRTRQEDEVKIPLSPVQVFHNSRHAEVRIYRVSQEAPL
jgi:hypothetical protein